MCSTARSQLIAWMDGELDNKDSHTIATHVALCPDCSREVRKISALSRDITEYCAAAVPDERRRFWMPAAVAAAAAIVVATGWLWTRTSPTVEVAVKPPLQQPAVLVARASVKPPSIPATPSHVRRVPRQRPVPPVIAEGGPGVTVMIPLDQVLPVGAAPPGALLVGNLTFDAGGQPSKIQLE